MSETFYLVCHETKQRMWIGQGWGQMTSFYTGEPETMQRLHDFLNAHIGKPLEFVCLDRDDRIYKYDHFGEDEDDG